MSRATTNYDPASPEEANALRHLGFAACWSVEYAPDAQALREEPPREEPQSAGEPAAGAGDQPVETEAFPDEDAAAPSDDDPEVLALALWNEGRRAEAIAVLEQQLARVRAPREAGSSPLERDLVETGGRALALIPPSAVATLQPTGSDLVVAESHALPAIAAAERQASRWEPGEIIHFSPEPRAGRLKGIHWVDMRRHGPRFTRRAWVAGLCLAALPALAAGAMLWRGADRAAIDGAQPAEAPSVAVTEAPAGSGIASRSDASATTTDVEDVSEPAPAGVDEPASAIPEEPEPAVVEEPGPAEPAVAEDRNLVDAPPMAEPAPSPPVAEPTPPPEEIPAETLTEPRVPTSRPTTPSLVEAPDDADMLTTREPSPGPEYADMPPMLAERRAAAERYAAERRAVAERAAEDEQIRILRAARGY